MKKIIAIALTSIVLISGCGFETGSLLAPVVTSVTPFSPRPGEEVVVKGKFFGFISDSSGKFKNGYGVKIGDQQLKIDQQARKSDILSWDENEIVIRIPLEMPVGETTLVVTADGEQSNPFPMFINLLNSQGFAAPLVGWIINDDASETTVFNAIVYGFDASNPEAWSLSTSDFADAVSPAEEDNATHYDLGREGWNVKLHDVSTNLQSKTAFVSFSAEETDGTGTFSGVRAFVADFSTEASGALAVGALPKQLAQWGPPAVLAEDNSMSVIDLENAQISNVFFLDDVLELGFEAESFFGDAKAGIVFIVGNNFLRETGEIWIIDQNDPSNTLFHGSYEDFVFQGVSYGDTGRLVITAQARSGASVADGSSWHILEFDGGPVAEDEIEIELTGDVEFPAGVTPVDFIWTGGKLHVIYDAAGEDDDGYVAIHKSGLNNGKTTLEELKTETFETLTAAEVSSTTVTASAEGYDGDFYEIEYQQSFAAVSNTTVAIQWDELSSTPTAYGISISSTEHNGYVTSAAGPFQIYSGGAAPAYLPQIEMLGPPTFIFTPHNYAVNFDLDNSAEFTISVEENFSGVVTLAVELLDDYGDIIDDFTIEITAVAGKVISVPIAADSHDISGFGAIADPTDIYLIPTTPLALVTNHALNSIAVINTATMVPTYQHSFPSYGVGPNRISCGIPLPDVEPDDSDENDQVNDDGTVGSSSEGE